MAQTSEEADPDNGDMWKEVHSVLTEAVNREKETITSLRAQRRYWLEELGANLDQGKLTATSVWRKPIALKKGRKKTPGKRKKAQTAEKASKKPRKSPEQSTAEQRQAHADMSKEYRRSPVEGVPDGRTSVESFHHPRPTWVGPPPPPPPHAFASMVRCHFKGNGSRSHCYIRALLIE